VASGASSEQLHGELRRLHLAQKDLESADALLQLLEDRPHYQGSDWGSVAEGLWTGVAVSYMRPFTKSPLRVAEEWERFENRSDLQQRHDRLRLLRDKLFAHTDPSSGREVLLMPLGGSAAEGRGFVTEQRATFRHAAIAEIRELIDFQQERIGVRVEGLVAELSRRGDWRVGDLYDA
jgi:hypothetical protein